MVAECDQIWRNFATWQNFKVFVYSLRLFLYSSENSEPNWANFYVIGHIFIVVIGQY